MNTTIELVLAVTFIAIAFVLGFQMGFRQQKRRRDFHAGVLHAAPVLAAYTIALNTPAVIAWAATAVEFPLQYTSAFGTFSAFTFFSSYIHSLCEMFALLGLPFYAGMWWRYRGKAAAAVQA